MMCRLLVSVFAVFLAAVSVTASESPDDAGHPACDVNKCLKILHKEGITCRSVPKIIRCARTTLLPNPKCSERLKVVIREKIQEGEKFLKIHCHGEIQPLSLNRRHEAGTCSLDTCLQSVIAHGINCKSVSEGIDCAVKTLLDNPACPDVVQNWVSDKLQVAVDYIFSQCRDTPPEAGVDDQEPAAVDDM